MKRLTFFIAILLCLQSCGKSKIEESTAPLRPVKYEKVLRSGGKNYFTYSGVAQSNRETKLSFRVAGTIRAMNVKLGDRVRAGQLIATMDPSDYSIQAEQAAASQKSAEANLQSANTQLITTRTTYQRIEKLYENNSVPLSDFEQAKSAFETAQAQYDAAKNQLTSASKQTEAARNQVDYTRLIAPFSGIITAVNVEANELVGSGSPVAILNSEDNPEVSVGIPENIISSIKVDQKVEIHFSVLPAKSFEGRVEEVSYAAGSSPTYPAIVRIINPSPEIRPGMAATVTFDLSRAEEGEKQFLLSPVPSIGEDGGGNFVFVLQPAAQGAYKVEKRTVKIGKLLPNGFEILEGLKEEELVATAGLKSLLDGMNVKLLEE